MPEEGVPLEMVGVAALVAIVSVEGVVSGVGVTFGEGGAGAGPFLREIEFDFCKFFFLGGATTLVPLPSSSSFSASPEVKGGAGGGALKGLNALAAGLFPISGLGMFRGRVRRGGATIFRSPESNDVTVVMTGTPPKKRGVDFFNDVICDVTSRWELPVEAVAKRPTALMTGL